jgi:hypothetical protein
MKKTAVLICVLFALGSCERNNLYEFSKQNQIESATDVTGVALNKTGTVILVGNTEQLFATVIPLSALNQNIYWSSSNNPAASVNASGVVTALADGTAIITVTTEEGGFTAQCTVTVSTTPLLPTVNTTAIIGNFEYSKKIAGTEAMAGGDVTSDGGAAVTERGVCWNTSGSPVFGIDTCSASSAGTGPFDNEPMTGLTVTTTYYVRAYAVNSAGTSHGNEITFNSGYEFGAGHDGGYVFYNDGIGGGMVVTTTLSLAPQVWIYGGTTQISILGTTGTIFGSGENNSSLITGQAGHTASAADACLVYWDGTYSDWYLPSKDEMQRMWEILANTLAKRTTYEFEESEYWSSSENNASTAWAMYFSDGTWQPADKSDNTIYVRPVRNFLP